MEISDLTHPERVELERWSLDHDPTSPLTAFVSAYTSYTVLDQSGERLRAEVAAGPDTLVAMTIPVRMAAALARQEFDELARLTLTTTQCGPLTQRLALINALAMVARAAHNNPEGAARALQSAALREELTPALAIGERIRQPELLAESIGEILARVTDPLVALLDAVRFAAATAEDPDAFAARMDRWAAEWPVKRWFDENGARVEAP